MFLTGYIEVTTRNKMNLHSVFTNVSPPTFPTLPTLPTLPILPIFPTLPTLPILPTLPTPPIFPTLPTPPIKKGCAKVLSTSGTALLTLTYNSKRRLSIIFLLCFLHVVAGRQSIELLKHS